MTRKTPLLLASILTATALLASAPTASEASTLALAAPPEKPVPKRLEFDVGMLVGGINMGTTHADATGLAINTGVRFGEFSILGELNYFGVRAEERGTMTRVGLTTRYSLVPLGDPKSFVTSDLWLEGGVGWEHVSWRSGGVLDRPDLALGFGWQTNFVMDKHSDHPRYLGPYFALRTLIGQGPETNDEATCGGPCDRATAPASTDVSFMFHVGINWGRMSF